MRNTTRVDCDPDMHNFLDAIGTVSFKLACGCRVPPGRPEKVTNDDEIHLFKRPGCTYECEDHGEVVITRATTRLTGWKQGEPALKMFGPTGEAGQEEWKAAKGG